MLCWVGEFPMRSPWRSCVACPWFTFSQSLFVCLVSFFVATPASAQSSVAFPATAATGRSLQDAAAKNEQDFIIREALGGAFSGVGAFSTGRLRVSDHDGLRPRTATTFAYETEEASAFANFVFSTPGIVLGGQLKFNVFAGHNWLSLDLKSNALAVLDDNQFGRAENQSFIAGVTALWAMQSSYLVFTLIGTLGETRLVDSVDDCFDNGMGIKGCNINRYRFDTMGFIGSASAGKVLDIGGANGPKLDLRGTIAYTQNTSDPFKNVTFGLPDPGDEGGGFVQKYWFSTWTGTAAATLFANIPMANSALFRPYIQGYVRGEWDYRNENSARDPDTGEVLRAHLNQRPLYGGLDAGFTYAIDKMTLGAAIYYEGSSDEATVGGRLGASWKLN